jgi:hypothetical protein
MANWWDDPDLQEAPAPKKPSLWDNLRNTVVQAVSNHDWGQTADYISEQAQRGITDIPGFIGDAVLNPVRDLKDIPKQLTGIYHGLTGGPTKQDLQNTKERFERPGVVSGRIEKALGPTVEEPQDSVDRYIGSSVRGAISGAPFGGVGAVSGAGSGVGMEAGSDLFPDSPVAPIIGGLIGGVAPETLHTVVPRLGTSIRNGIRQPNWKAVNDIIVNDLEGGGTLENPKISKKGAMGPQQVMPDTARDPGFGIKPWDGKTQSDLARVGRQYSAALMDKYDGDVAKVLAAYNGGFGRVDNLIAKYGDNWLSHMPKETRNYVRKGLDKLPSQAPENLGESTLVRDELPATYEQAYVNHGLTPGPDVLPHFSDGTPKLPSVLQLEQDTGKAISYKTQKIATDFANELEIDPDLLMKQYIESHDGHLGNIKKNLKTDWDDYQKEAAAIDAKYDQVPFIKDNNPEPGTPEFNNKYGYEDDLTIPDEDYGYVYDDEPVDLEDHVGSTPYYQGQSNTDSFYAPYDSKGKHFVSIDNYEASTGKKIGPLTKQAIEEYAKDNGIHPDSVASHFLSDSGDSIIKDGVSLWRDELAKEQMTPKEYKAYQKLPTTDPKVLKVLSKYLEPGLVKPKESSPLAKVGMTFLRMMKDDRGGTAPSPEELHGLITEWNKGTRYLLKGPDGTPLRIYHGTKYQYEGLPSGEKNRMPYGYVLYSTDPEFASRYATKFGGKELGEASRVFPAYVKNDPAIADFRKPEDLAKAVEWYKKKQIDRWGVEHDLARGAWDMWERPDMLKDNGWTGAFLTESMADDKGPRLNIMLEDHLVKSIFDPSTYRNNTIGHKIVRTMTDMLRDETGAIGKKPVEDAGYEGLSPEQKLIKAIDEAKPLSGQQKRAYNEARAEKAAKLADIQANGGGMEGYKAQMAQLKGQLPKVDYESIAEHFTPKDIDTLLNRINGNNWLLPYEKMNAQTSLLKLLGAEGAKVPSQAELKLLAHVFPEEMVDALMRNRPFAKRFWNGVSNAINIPRSLMASFDLSAPLRQGVFMVGRKEFYPAFAKMFQLFGSEKASQALMQSIRDRDTYPLMRRAGLALTNPEGKFLDAREEAFMSTWAEKIPVIGRGVKASDRAYSGFLNKLRADTFDSLVKLSKEAGVDLEKDGKALRDMAKYINSATGRGDVAGLIQKNAHLLNGLFFSPRLIASRMTMLNPAFYVQLTPVVRKEAIKSLIGFSAIALTALNLAKHSGLQVETDPRSADFAKIKDGDTRYDILGGFQQYIRFGAQMISGETKTASGKINSLTKGEYGKDTRLDTAEKFFENKFSPVASFIADYLRGKDPAGKKFTWTKEIASRFIPLVAQDTADAFKEYGAKGLLSGIPGIFGVGVQTYKPKKPKTKAPKKEWWEQ